MNAAILTLLMCPMVQYESLPEDGTIHGVVLNATDDGAPAGDVEVMLRAVKDERFAPVAQTTADSQGRFRFEKLPVGGDFLYLPGANRGGIHYPGPRVRLAPYNTQARVELQIHETQSHPNPLVAKQHVIRIQPEPEGIRVTESILINNPTSKTYVGRETRSEAKPVTLSLAIPPNFDRTTFDKEFFGRRFSFAGQKLITSIPWPPGQKELAFTYVVPNEARHVQWQRPLDLPCSDVQVYVTSDRPHEVRCNLGQVDESQNAGELAFASRGPVEPGHVLRVEFGDAPVPWSAYARWAAAAILVSLIAVTSVLILGRRSRESHEDAALRAKTTSLPQARPEKQERSRSRRHRRKQRAA